MAITRGMAVEPDVLLIGELSTILDALMRRKVQDGLLQLWDETRFTVLLATHSVPKAIRCGSCVLILSPHPGQVRTGLPSLACDDDGPERFEALEAEIHNVLSTRAMEEACAD